MDEGFWSLPLEPIEVTYCFITGDHRAGLRPAVRGIGEVTNLLAWVCLSNGLDQHPGGGIEVRDLSKDHQLFDLQLRHSGSDWVAVHVAVNRTQ